MSGLAAALAKAQQEFEAIREGGENPHFRSKFATLEDILTEVRPKLNKHGLALLQHPTIVDGQPALRTKLLHESGESEEDTMLLLLDKQNAQGLGSALSYARRYALLSTLGLATEDDDGNAAVEAPKKAKPAAKGSGAKPAATPDPDFSSDPPPEEVLAEIRKHSDALVAATDEKSADVRKSLAGLNWRTNATEAQMALHRIRIWAEEQVAA